MAKASYMQASPWKGDKEGGSWHGAVGLTELS